MCLPSDENKALLKLNIYLIMTQQEKKSEKNAPAGN